MRWKAFLLACLFLLGLAGPAAAQQSAAPEVVIRTTLIEPAATAPGEKCRVELILHNTGLGEARNIAVTFASAHFAAASSDGMQTVAGLQPGEQNAITQELQAAAHLEAGAYPVTIQATYQDLQGREYTATELLSILVAEDAAVPTPAPEPTQPAARPLVFIRASRTEPAVSVPGQLTRLYLELHNVGDSAARQIVISIAGQNFIPELTSSVKTIASLQPNEHGSVWQDLRVAPALETGAYPITIQMSYLDLTGREHSTSETVGINVSGPAATATPKPAAPGRPQIIIDAFATAPDVLLPGSPFTLTVVLRNTGTGAARNVAVTHGAPSAFAAAGTGSVTSVGAIGWQGTVTATIPMIVDQAAKEGLNSHPITLNYMDVSGAPIESAQSIALRVAAGGEVPPANALIVIESYATDPAALSPGQAFTLTLLVRNVSAVDARRVSLTLGAPSYDSTTKSAPIAPLGSGNVRYLPEVKAGALAEVVSQFIVDGNANAGVYILTVGIGLAGVETTSATRNDQHVSLVVKVQPQLIFSFYREIPEYQVGMPLELPIEVLNMGRGRLASNIVEVFSDQLQMDNFRSYVGPLDAGTSNTIDAQAMADTPGEKFFTVRVHYIDDFNQPQVVDGEMSVMVADLPEWGGPDGPPNPDDGTGGGIPPQPQRPWFIRLLRGLFGLGSS